MITRLFISEGDWRVEDIVPPMTNEEFEKWLKAAEGLNKPFVVFIEATNVEEAIAQLHQAFADMQKVMPKVVVFRDA